MRQILIRAMLLLSRKIPPTLKDKLLNISYIRRVRNIIYQRSNLQPFSVSGLPFNITLYLNPAHPGERLFITRKHEPHVVQNLLRIVKPGWIIFDIGSFIGFYTVLFGKLCSPDGRVIAFEPVPSLKQQILLSCEANGLKNVHVESLALGADVGEV